MGMLYQFGALFTDLTVFENVAFPLREHTELPEALIRDLVLLKLNAVGLRGAAQFRTSQLSGGMARRVALARAIALDPPLIMYDEPFAGLDPVALATVATLIRKLNDALECRVDRWCRTTSRTPSASPTTSTCSRRRRIVAGERPTRCAASDDANVRQFLDGSIDGPVAFHYQAAPLAEDLGVSAMISGAGTAARWLVDRIAYVGYGRALLPAPVRARRWRRCAGRVSWSTRSISSATTRCRSSWSRAC